jgi:hypothetical protein
MARDLRFAALIAERQQPKKQQLQTTADSVNNPISPKTAEPGLAPRPGFPAAAGIDCDNAPGRIHDDGPSRSALKAAGMGIFADKFTPTSYQHLYVGVSA